MIYKCEWYGRELIKIDKFFPSSKLCNNCKTKNNDLTLRDREWTCSSCKQHLNRDLNAAYNILEEGLRLLTEGRDCPVSSLNKETLVSCS